MSGMKKHTHWRVEVQTCGETIVAIEPEHLAGREPSWADVHAIRKAAYSLLGFIGDDIPSQDTDGSHDFSSDDEALELLLSYGHEETRNGAISGDWRAFNEECRAAVKYLCDEWDFVFENVPFEPEAQAAVAIISSPKPTASASGETIMKRDVEAMILSWQEECSEHPSLHNQGNVLLSRLRNLKPSLSMEDFLTGMDAQSPSANERGE